MGARGCPGSRLAPRRRARGGRRRRGRARAPGRGRARRLRDERRAPARGDPEAGSARARRRARGRRSRSGASQSRQKRRGPASSTSTSRTPGSPRPCGEILEAGNSFGAGSAAERERIQVEMVSANPTGPITSPTPGTRAYGDSVARLLELRRARGRARVLLQRRGSADGALLRVRRGGPARRGAAGGRLPRRVRRRARGRSPGDPGAADARADRGVRSSASASTSTRGRARASSRREVPEAIELLDTFEEDGAVWARTSAHGDDKDRVLVRSDGTPTYFARDAAYIAEEVRARPRPAHLRPRRRPPRLRRDGCGRSRACSGTRPSRSRCSSTSSSTSSRAARRRRSRSGAATSSSSTSCSTRSAWTRRAGISSRAATTRRSSSTSTSRSERTQKNPVYYVQYAHARIAGILRNAEGADVRPRRRAGPLASEERDLVKRLLEFPALVAEAAERRAPHAIPTYAIRVADDFHRFYHHHRVLESEQRAFRLGLVRATQLVVARCLDLIGVSAPERM